MSSALRRPVQFEYWKWYWLGAPFPNCCICCGGGGGLPYPVRPSIAFLNRSKRVAYLLVVDRRCHTAVGEAHRSGDHSRVRHSLAVVVVYANSRCRSSAVVVRQSRHCTEVEVMGCRIRCTFGSQHVKLMHGQSAHNSRVLLLGRVLLLWWVSVVLLRRWVAGLLVALAWVVRHAGRSARRYMYAADETKSD